MTDNELEGMVGAHEGRIARLENEVGDLLSKTKAAGYAVGWFTLALINAGLAKALNVGTLRWFLLSLFMGPCATCTIVSC